MYSRAIPPKNFSERDVVFGHVQGGGPAEDAIFGLNVCELADVVVP